MEPPVVQINENLLNVGNPRQKKKSLKSGNDRAVDYEDEIAAESCAAAANVEGTNVESIATTYSSTIQPSSLFLTVPDANGGFRRSSYDEQAFRERQKILNRDYLKATDPDYYRRAGSVDHTCKQCQQ